MTDVECSVSMESVLRCRYQRKMEHRVVPLYETLPPPHRLIAIAPVPPLPVGSSTTSGNRPGSHTVVTLSTASPKPTGSATDGVVDSKVGIVAGARRVAEKRKAFQAMSGSALTVVWVPLGGG